MSHSKGATELFSLVVMAVIIVLVFGLIGTVLREQNVIKIKDYASVTIENDQQGRVINVFLQAGNPTSAELLGGLRALNAPTPNIQEKLDILHYALVVKDADDKVLRKWGDVRSDRGFFIDIPLAGGRKGRLGVDHS